MHIFLYLREILELLDQEDEMDQRELGLVYS